MASLKMLMVLLPLTYTLMLYLVTNNIGELEGITLLSVIIGGVATAVIASLNILGSGLNAAGTIMVFILLFGGMFYGASVTALTTSGGAHLFMLFNFGRSSQVSTAGGVIGPNNISFPYSDIVDALFGIMYALGLYMLIADRGEG
jgi:hypothetical protein